MSQTQNDSLPVAFTAYIWLSLLLPPVQGTSPIAPHVVKCQTGPYKGVTSWTVLGDWPFFNSFNGVSLHNRGPALVNGANVTLMFTRKSLFVQIRQPGFLSIPAVDIRTINFAIKFSLRLPSAPTSRGILLINWQSGQWQYIMTVDAAGTISFDLRCNLYTNGSDPTQDLVSVTTAAKVPVGTFFKVVYVYNTTIRTFSVYIDGSLSASAVVRAGITDLTLHTSTQPYFQFGNKGEDVPVTGELNADLNQLRFLELTF